ncbi:DUF5358 family protein [Mannheimia sp. E30BD]|uniref:DUF5358 family protein n=1 Tax=Mannheimia sp. E30BD TaxID=3278708 RepID=UPI00359E7924
MKIKIGLLIMSSAILSACTNNSLYNSLLTSSEPKYKISDEDIKKWIIEGNKIEQCIFNKEYRNNDFSKLTKIEQALHNKEVYLNTLISVIGENNVQIISSDPASQRYIEQQLQKFNHSESAKFDKKWCQDVKRNYQMELNKLKAEQKAQAALMKKRQLEEQKRQEQLEKESAARQAYYATPQGQAALVQQQMLAQQQAMQQQMAAQQQQMYEAQQWNQLNQQIQNMNQSIQQSNQQMMQMYNNRTKNVSCYNALGNVTCYSY